MLDEQAPVTGAFAAVKSGHSGKSKDIYGDYAQRGDDGLTFHGDGLQGASRFFYVAKASKRERNLGLDSTLMLKYNIPKEIIRKDILCKDVSMVAVQLLKKVMSESTIKWFIVGSGESIMGLCLKGLLSTTLTIINKTIASKTLVSLHSCIIKESTQAAKSLTANGGSPAENVASLRKFLQTITKGSLELALGASRVVSAMLLITSAKENWQQMTNTHPTVKSLKLMQYLCRLLKPPQGGILLDCFGGSGSTAVACINTGWDYILIEKEAEYCEIARKRVAWIKEQQAGQLPLFKVSK